MNKIFIISFKISGTKHSIMPEGISGAYVNCYAVGETYVDATEKALKKLVEDGLHPDEILQPIHEMDISAWSGHVIEKWPNHASRLPSQSEFEKLMSDGRVVYGPFGSY